ncbi:MerR family transcriptional regulator [Cryptosporangium minutisporangium]|uniref:MerR family transcriptional regulator n=1 Tax=Cryptosporangium minutisporangium TaxID=113569 RepID=A0ABP6TCB6_9ACTN
MDERRWKVGELARASGVTVRTLHHFDVIGLLRPAERSAAGHRLYTAADVRRLYQVLGLRYLGLSLAEVTRALDGGPAELGPIVERQRSQVDREFAALHDLRRRLATLQQALREARDPSIDELIRTMEAMMQSSYFTPEQLAAAAARHREPGFDDRFAGWQDRCGRLVATLRPHLEAGTDPADPDVQRLAGLWSAVLDEMTGGDRGVRSAIYAKLDGQGPDRATRGIVDAASWDYLKRAFAVGYGGAPTGDGTA